jgi:heme exporter protein B
MLAILGLLMYGALSVVAGNPLADQGIFFIAIGAGSIGISLCFTFISAIAVKSDQSTTLMTIMSFPLVIPTLLHLIRLSLAALPEPMITNITPGLLTLLSIDLLVFGLALLLFPYLWRS